MTLPITIFVVTTASSIDENTPNPKVMVGHLSEGEIWNQFTELLGGSDCELIQESETRWTGVVGDRTVFAFHA